MQVGKEVREPFTVAPRLCRHPITALTCHSLRVQSGVTMAQPDLACPCCRRHFKLILTLL